jgi:amino acid transporter
MILPYNDPALAFAGDLSNGASASPFVAAITVSGIQGLPHVLNACILVFVFSASNSDLYIASRTLYGLALEGKAPRFLARTDRRGVPIYALALSACFSLLAFMNVSQDSTTVFKYFVNLTTIFGILTWISILVTHIHFVKARRAQGVSDEEMAYVSPFGLTGSVCALVGCCIIAVFKNFNVFTRNPKYGVWDYKNFITGYLGIPLYLIMIFGYKLVHRGSGIRPEEVDLFAGKEQIDREEEEFLRAQEARGEGKGLERVYRRYIAWLF